MFHRPQRYTFIAIAFHWLLAILIIGTFALGVYMHELPLSPSRLKLYNYHKWLGITVLGLSALRLLWRLSHRPPEANDQGPAWQAQIAKITHWLLYVLFFAVPLSGWAYSSAAGFPIVYLGVLALPDWVPKDRGLSEMLRVVHEVFAKGLGFLVLLHVLAAFKHHWVNKDRLLTRMSPFSR